MFKNHLFCFISLTFYLKHLITYWNSMRKKLRFLLSPYLALHTLKSKHSNREAFLKLRGLVLHDGGVLLEHLAHPVAPLEHLPVHPHLPGRELGGVYEEEEAVLALIQAHDQLRHLFRLQLWEKLQLNLQEIKDICLK